MADIIQLTRGLKANLPKSAPSGQPLFCEDTSELFIGLGHTITKVGGDTVKTYPSNAIPAILPRGEIALAENNQDMYVGTGTGKIHIYGLFKTLLQSQVPKSIEAGSTVYCTDTGNMYIGTGSSNIEIQTKLQFATESEAIAGLSESKVVSPKAMKKAIQKAIEDAGGVGGGGSVTRNVFEARVTPSMSIVVNTDTDTFTIPNYTSLNRAIIRIQGLTLELENDYTITNTGVVTLLKPIKAGTEVFYDLASHGFSYNDLADNPIGDTTELTTVSKEVIGAINEINGKVDSFNPDVNVGIADVTGLQSALDSKAASDHNHDNSYAPKTHNHTGIPIANITGLQGTLDGKSANHDHPYAPSVHSHNLPIANITGLQGALDGKSANHDHPYSANNHLHTGVYQPAGSYAASNHSHTLAIANITGLQGEIDGLKQSGVNAKTSVVNAVNAKAGTSLTTNNTWGEVADTINSIQSIPTTANLPSEANSNTYFRPITGNPIICNSGYAYTAISFSLRCEKTCMFRAISDKPFYLIHVDRRGGNSYVPPEFPIDIALTSSTSMMIISPLRGNFTLTQMTGTATTFEILPILN